MNKPDIGVTHWAGCEEKHHHCALKKLKQAQAEIARLKKELEIMQIRDALTGHQPPQCHTETGTCNEPRLALDAEAGA